MSIIIEDNYDGVDVVFELDETGSAKLRTDLMEGDEEIEAMLAAIALGFGIPNWYSLYLRDVENQAYKLLIEGMMSDGLFKLWTANVIAKLAATAKVFQGGADAEFFKDLVSQSQAIADDVIRDEVRCERTEDPLFGEEEDERLRSRMVPEYWEEIPTYGDKDEDFYAGWIREGMLTEAGEIEEDRIRQLVIESRELFRAQPDLSLEHDVAYALLEQAELLEQQFVFEGDVDVGGAINSYNGFKRKIDGALSWLPKGEDERFWRWANGHAVALVEASVELP